MRYQEYLRWSRRVRKVKAAVRSLGYGLVVAGIVVFCGLAMAADALPIRTACEWSAVCVGLTGAGIGLGRI